MKILQELLLLGYSGGLAPEEEIDLGFKAGFNKSKYTGIQHIYLKGQMYIDAPDTGFTLTIWDEVNSVLLASFHQETSGWHDLVSADVQADLANNTEIKAYLAPDEGSEGNPCDISNLCVVVEQEDNTETKKTTLSLSLNTQYQYGYTTSYEKATEGQVKYKPNYPDGSNKIYFEATLGVVWPATGYACLYDVTADAVVAGSEVTTTNEEPTIITSGELTLIDDHVYCLALKTSNSAQESKSTNSCIKQVQENFTKCNTSVCSFGSRYTYPGGSYIDTSAPKLYPASKIDADIVTAYISAFALFDFDAEETQGIRLYNNTDAAVVPDTTMEETGSSEEIWSVLSNEIVQPTDQDSISLEGKGEHSFTVGPVYIICYLSDQEVVGTYLPADPNQPTGYHCFMSQYLKNTLTGNIPLLTPDGVNKCW